MKINNIDLQDAIDHIDDRQENFDRRLDILFRWNLSQGILLMALIIKMLF